MRFDTAPALALILSSFLTGCGGGGGGSNTSGTYSLTGQAQKGPFAIGSQISVNELDNSLNPTGKVYNVQTTDSLGNFAVSSPIGTNLVEIVGNGFYMDELTGQLASSQIQLRAVADLSVNANPTINVLASLQGLRLKTLLSQGQTYAAATTQSQTEVLAAFGIDSTQVNSLTNLHSMRIDGTTDADAALLATSVILSTMATNAAIANGTTQTAELSNYINTSAAAIASTGTVTDPAFVPARNLAEAQINLADVRTNLETYYANRGVIIVAPRFEEWVDQSGAGIVPQRVWAPRGVFAVSGTGQISLSWSQVISATSYNIYWGTTAGVTIASTKITDATSPYVHTGLTAGSTYFYRVSAVNAGLEKLSNETYSFLYIGGNPAGVFTATGSMATNRSRHTATLLPNGKVLVAGGFTIGSLASAEIYDTGIFTATGSMGAARFGHTATLLPNGKVLVAGGSGTLASAEIYDPATGSFTATGSMGSARQEHTATLLPNGKVLVAGGTPNLTSAEIYNPATGSFTVTGIMATARMFHTATLLPNGKVVFAGGSDFLASAEIYDPAMGSFTATGSMGTGRRYHIATLLPNGKILVAGGYSAGNIGLASAEIYDPTTGSFTATGSMGAARVFPDGSIDNATLLSNGKVLVAGGGSLASAELFQ